MVCRVTKLFVENILPIQSWKILKENKTSVLVDVRDIKELLISGLPDLKLINKEVAHIPWKMLEQQDSDIAVDQYINKNFLSILREKIPDYSTTIIFICRSGIRSGDAAIFSSYKGYQKCYNIIGGFEPNNTQYCWKISGLPWKKYDYDHNKKQC
ncbi:sulfurtransferase [Rickettsiales bacterium]|nr:sulfurtransferase [Rickettsiales bacterium]